MEKKSLLLLIGLLIWGLSLASFGQAETKLEGVTISPGGAIDLKGGGFTLHDLKGQSVIGVSTSGTLKLEIGGIYGLAGEEKLKEGMGGVEGIVFDADNNKTIAGTKITIYQTNPIFQKTGVANDFGSYKIINISPGDYFLAAEANGYLPSYQTVKIEENKIVKVDFALTVGYTAPPGTVALMISRIEGTPNIKISWSVGNLPGQIAAPNLIDLYMLEGDGSGVFKNNNDGNTWKLVIQQGNLQDPADLNFILNITEHYLIHKDQFGKVPAEVYYKGTTPLPDGSPALGENPFPSAPAVGKINITLNAAPKWNLISMPFEIMKNSKGMDITEQLKENGTVLYGFNDATQQTSKASFDGNAWLIEGPEYEAQAGKAFWAWSPSVKTISSLGKVLQSAFTRTLYPGFNLIGYPFPNNIPSFADTPLKADPGNAAYWFDNSTQLTAKLEPSGGKWTDAGGGKVFGIYPKNGYWFYNASGKSIDWNILKP